MINFFDRLDKYMIFKGLNDNKLTVDTGISNGLIGKGRKRGSISQKNISKILKTYTELNADWLLTGEGSMLKSEGKVTQQATVSGGVNHKVHQKIEQTNKELLDIIKKKDEQIDRLLTLLEKK